MFIFYVSLFMYFTFFKGGGCLGAGCLFFFILLQSLALIIWRQINPDSSYTTGAWLIFLLCFVLIASFNVFFCYTSLALITRIMLFQFLLTFNSFHNNHQMLCLNNYFVNFSIPLFLFSFFPFFLFWLICLGMNPNSSPAPGAVLIN